jgi:hypothetical protein
MREFAMSQSAQSESPQPRPARRLWLKVLVWGLGIIPLSCVLIYLPCIELEKVRGSTARGSVVNNLKGITLSFHNYYGVYDHLPPPAITDKDGRPLLSWRVAMLPFIEQDNLYKQFRQDEPWDGPHNYALLAKMPKTYMTDWSGRDPPNTTHFQVFVGPGTAFEREGLTFKDFADGTGNTIALVDAANPVPWTKPDDLVYDPNGPLPQFTIHNLQYQFLCYSAGKKPCYLVGMMDASVRFIRADMPESTIRAMITRNGGEQVDASTLH